MIGKNFSNGWKKRPGFSNDWKHFFQWLENFGRFFQRLEEFFGGFPMIGKNFRAFSSELETVGEAKKGSYGVCFEAGPLFPLNFPGHNVVRPSEVSTRLGSSSWGSSSGHNSTVDGVRARVRGGAHL